MVVSVSLLLRPGDGQRRSPVLQPAKHAIGGRGEAQPAQHIHRHHGVAADDVAAASPSQPAAAGPASRAAGAQSAAAAAAPAAAHSQSAHGAFGTAGHGTSSPSQHAI